MDCDWPRIPDELLQLGLTRLHLRFADFADGAPWLAGSGWPLVWPPCLTLDCLHCHQLSLCGHLLGLLCACSAGLASCFQC